MHISTRRAAWRPTVKAGCVYRRAELNSVPSSSPSDQDSPESPTVRKQELVPSSRSPRALNRIGHRITTGSGHLLDPARRSAHRMYPC